MDENQTTVKFELKLIEKIKNLDDEGHELWSSIRVDPFTGYDIRNVPVNEIKWDDIEDPCERNIVTNEEMLSRLDRMASERLSWSELLKP
jgi:hypothetical protein